MVIAHLSRSALSLGPTLLLSLALACATNPVTGDREVILMSAEKEKEIDAQAALQVEAQLGIVDAPELAAYVDALGQKLAAESPRKDVRYHFAVVEMEEPNAFALPGGHIYVSRGLLLLSNSEAELAGVLGHEIGHVAARHAAQRDTLQKTLAVMSVLGAVGMAVGGPTSTGVRGPVGTPGLYSYSRSQESQADEIGVDLALDAGLDPAGIADFLNGLDEYGRLRRGYSRGTSYFDTHPATAGRAAAAATRADAERWESGISILPDRNAYLEMLDGLSIGTPAREGVIQDDRFLHPDMGFGVRFPTGWEIHNTRTAVYGVAPDHSALLTLELEAPGDDALAAARSFAERADVQLIDLRPVRVGDLEGVRAESTVKGPGGRARTALTWLAFEGHIYRLSGVALRNDGSRYAGVFVNFARSFKPLTEEDRAGIEEPRLEVVEALPGETLEALAERTGNEWTVSETAVHNGLPVDAPLAGGERVKISLRFPYPGEDQRGEVRIPASEE